MIPQDKAKDFAQNWIDAWNTHDLEKILSHYSEDIIFVSPFVIKLLNDPTGTIKGKTALRSYFAQGLEKYPNLKFQLHKVLAGVQSITLYYESVNNLIAAEVMELSPDWQVLRVTAHYAPK